MRALFAPRRRGSAGPLAPGGVVPLLLASLGLLAPAGCGRPSPPAAATATAPTPAVGAGTRAPTPADLTVFLRADLGAAAGVMRFEVQADPPMPAGAGTWTMQAKLTPVAEADLFTLARSGEAPTADELHALEERRDVLARWAEGFAKTPFARRLHPAGYPAVPAGRPVPSAWLVRRTERGHRFPPLYARFRAEWQVDRWGFAPEARHTPDAGLATLEAAGEARAALPVNAVVVGSPEAQALLAAARQSVVQARDRQAQAEAAYGRFIAAATAPGARYIGQISPPQGPPLPAEVRFVEAPGPPAAPSPTPAAGSDAAPAGRPVAFEVRLPGRPDYGLAFTGTGAGGPPLGEGGPDLRAVCTQHRGELGSPLSSALGNLLRGAAGEPFGDAEKRLTFTEAGDELTGSLSAFNGNYRLAVKRAP